MKSRRGPSDRTRDVLAAWLVVAVIAAAVSGLLALGEGKVSAGRAMLPPKHWSVRSHVGAGPPDEDADRPRATLPGEILDDGGPANLGDVSSRVTE
jgi:hypothetical protein